jgi:PqqD family protein of HPr-rel-A system
LLLRLAQRTLLERYWDDECVVFDTYSGETHYLNPLATAIFRRISASGSADLDALCAELIHPGDGEGAPEVSPDAIGSAAARLRHIGLIRIEDSET